MKLIKILFLAVIANFLLLAVISVYIALIAEPPSSEPPVWIITWMKFSFRSLLLWCSMAAGYNYKSIIKSVKNFINN